MTRGYNKVKKQHKVIGYRRVESTATYGYCSQRLAQDTNTDRTIFDELRSGLTSEPASIATDTSIIPSICPRDELSSLTYGINYIRTKDA